MSYSVQAAVSAFAGHALGDDESRDKELEAMPVEGLDELVHDLKTFAALVHKRQKAFQRSSRT